MAGLQIFLRKRRVRFSKENHSVLHKLFYNLNYMICPQDNNKQYIIPTKKWLKPIEKLITEGLLVVSKFIDKEEVIVKITKQKKENIKKYAKFYSLYEAYIRP